MTRQPSIDEMLPYTVATWAFTLHVAGVPAADGAVREHCQRVLAAKDASSGNEAGEALVARVRELLAGADPDSVAHAAVALFGPRIGRDLGEGDRMVRTARIRKYQFASQLPWLARIWERQGDAVRPIWLLVERVTDQVTAADPNPWNDIDEERRIPVADFHVLWELDACANLYVTT